MKTNKIHRVIVEDSKSSTYTGFITNETIFEYFIENHYSDMEVFQGLFKDFNLSTNNLITVDKNETIYNCLMMLYDNRISFLPILEEDKELFGFLYLKDIVYFFANGEKFTVKLTFNNSSVIRFQNLFLIYILGLN